MNNKLSFIFLMYGFAVLAVVATPLNAYAETPPGPVPAAPDLLSCRNIPQAINMSAGLAAAQGGGFVPVSDAAVTRNTGLLIYKECILRAMVDDERKSEIAQLVRKSATDFLTKGQVCTVDDAGVETCTVGGAMFPENLDADQQKWSKNVVDANVNGTLLNQISPAYQNDVKTTIARTYAQQTNNPGASLACPYTGNLVALNNGAYNGPQDLFAIANPNCNPMGAYFNAQSMVMSNVAANQANMMARLSWNNGVYDVTVTKGGVTRVVTPGFLVAATLQQQLGSSFRMLENANDVGQLIDSLFRNIGNAILSSASNGLMGLMNNPYGTGSYLDAIVAQTGAAVTSGQVGATLDAVLAMYKNETAYNVAKSATRDVLTNAMAQLRGAESTCWTQIGAYADRQNPKITGIIPKTTASQTIINSNNLATLASSTQAEVDASTAILVKITQLILGVSNGSISGADAYNQISALLASGAHTAEQVIAEVQKTTDLQTALQTVVTSAITAWQADWCNTTNPTAAVIAGWKNP